MKSYLLDKKEKKEIKNSNFFAAKKKNKNIEDDFEYLYKVKACKQKIQDFKQRNCVTMVKSLMFSNVKKKDLIQKVQPFSKLILQEESTFGHKSVDVKSIQ